MNYKWASYSKFHQSNSLSCEQISPRILCVELNDDDDDGNDDDDDDKCSPKLVESESGVRKLALARIAAFTRNHQASLHQTRLHDILASNQTLVCLRQCSFHSQHLFKICLHQKPPSRPAIHQTSWYTCVKADLLSILALIYKISSIFAFTRIAKAGLHQTRPYTNIILILF